jgi:hypothetical protein
MIARVTRGVWFSDRPLDTNEGVRGDMLLRITLPLGRRELDKYEWVEESKPYREWQLPAALVNSRHTSLVVIPPWPEMLLKPKVAWSGNLYVALSAPRAPRALSIYAGRVTSVESESTTNRGSGNDVALGTKEPLWHQLKNAFLLGSGTTL